MLLCADLGDVAVDDQDPRDPSRGAHTAASRPVDCRPEDALELGGIDRDRVAAGRGIDRCLAADDRGLVGAHAYFAERVRYSKFAAYVQHPVQKALEAALRQVEYPRDDLRLLGDGMAVECYMT